MNIAQVDVNYNFSSTGKIVADLVAGLDERGHTAMACYGRGPEASDPRAHRIGSKAEVLAHALGTRVTGLTGGFSPVATAQLLSRFDRFKPDVVHLHDLHGYFLNIGPLVEYLKARRIPTLWTFHSEFMYTGKCGYANDCEKWRTMCARCPDLHGYPQSWWFDFTTRMFQQKQAMFADFQCLHLTAPSQWLADRMRQSMVRDKPISVVYNGLDTDKTFRRRDARELRASLGLSDEYIVLSVGSDLLSERKGGRWVLELAERQSAADNVVFVMVGVEQMPKQEPANVRLLPRLYDQDLLAQYYSMADLLLLSSAKETFSMVCAESLACGTPIIGFDSGAPKEVAPPGYGTFVPYADLGALEDLLASARAGQITLASPQECERFAKARYGKQAMVAAYEAIYQDLIHKQSGRQ